MEKAFDELNGTAFRQARAFKYEKKYNREHNAAQKNERFEELYDKAGKALGATGGQLLRDLTDCVIELYNTDAIFMTADSATADRFIQNCLTYLLRTVTVNRKTTAHGLIKRTIPI